MGTIHGTTIALIAVITAAVGMMLSTDVLAENGAIRVFLAETNLLAQVRGDPDVDWHIQSSTDLVNWITLTNVRTLLSGGAKAPIRTIGTASQRMTFYRALKTGGLFDPTLLRTFSLTFTQANWQTQLADGRTKETDAYCSLLALDNGAENVGVGARYRGNTSYTGMGGSAPVKKSINIETDFTVPGQDLMGYDTINLNNAYGDETIMRESLYFNVMRNYTICPAACLAQLYINGANWGVYSCVQQQDGRLIREYCPGSSGDRWRAPNMAGGGGPGGGFSSGASALTYLGNTNISTYTNKYELKSDYNTNAWPRLINAIYVLNTTPTNQLREKAEDVLAVDRWLWFFALENIFADDDSYWNKGADYMFYYEPESGRIHPVEHDGNESFVQGDASLSPVRGLGDSNRPLINRLLSIPELRQRYIAHMRTVIDEYFNPPTMNALIDRFVAVSVAAIAADPKKGYTSMATYTNDLNSLRSFITNRYKYLTNHAELKLAPPSIVAVCAPAPSVAPGQVPFVTAHVVPNGSDGIDSVWLYHRGKPYGKFSCAQMFDDGAHGDGVAGDGIFGAQTADYPPGTKVRFYIEARSGNSSKTASFSPPRAEQQTWSYRVALLTAPSTPVIINEIMADNQTAFADPQGEFDDWIELHNLTDHEIDMSGRYLSDEPNNPRKWQFPPGTRIPPDGYLIVWADENGSETPGLHASFKLSKSGEELFLADTDANYNAVLDRVVFGAQQTDVSYGRSAANPDQWTFMPPTPNEPNQ
ncbi:MAG: CotH kinase family protein [Verrucomicrobiota bacterium]|nr:CotH kinase family protein [Verrucomicrobiota bacterium]